MKEPIREAQTRVAPGAVLVGEVRLCRGASVWYNAVLRADAGPITVGEGSNVQDCCVLHVSEGFPLTLGRGVTVGHGAVLHGCTVGDNTVVGMGAILLNGARVGADCLIGAGALVTEGTVIPDGTLAFGSPARPVRPLTDAEIAHNHAMAQHYLLLAAGTAEA